MKITDVQTYLVDAGWPQHNRVTNKEEKGGWSARNWLFVKISTDKGIYGIGEASGWPRVVETAINDLTPLLVYENPFHIERIWHKMLASIMGHGMTGVVGGGALSGIEMALWDLKGKALGQPVWNLFGGKMRDQIRIYGHANSKEQARSLVDHGYTAIKTGGTQNVVENVKSIRQEVGKKY